jgi:hypothetical protein
MKAPMFNTQHFVDALSTMARHGARKRYEY